MPPFSSRLHQQRRCLGLGPLNHYMLQSTVSVALKVFLVNVLSTQSRIELLAADKSNLLAMAKAPCCPHISLADTRSSDYKESCQRRHSCRFLSVCRHDRFFRHSRTLLALLFPSALDGKCCPIAQEPGHPLQVGLVLMSDPTHRKTIRPLHVAM
jgi:hypothetical protein